MLPISETKSVWSRLKSAKKPIFLYGMGDGAQKIIDLCVKHGIQLSGVFASDEFVRGHYFNGYKVQKYSEILEKYEDIIVVVAFGTAKKEVIEHIYKLCIEQEMYVPDVSIADKENFDEEFLQKHLKEMEFVYSRLEDASKSRYCNLINFKLSGKLFYLDMFETPKNEIFPNYLHINGEESYADVGAYNGDTILEFTKYAKTYKNIYAIEPDKKNYQKLLKNTGHLPNIEYFNIGIHKEYAKQGFDGKSGRNSKINENSANMQTFNSLDNLLVGKKVTYIKIDAEGEEVEGIWGAKNILKAQKPKLNIATYHKPSDIFTIPTEVLKLREDYKISLLHTRYIPAWDTNFIFI